MAKHAFAALAVAAALVAVVLALVLRDGDEGDPGSGNPESQLSVEEATAPLKTGPPELRALRDDANQLLGGEVEDFGRALEELRGIPVVVNSWASWCGPCRYEFPVLQEAAIERGDEIAFVGALSEDSEEAASTFLEKLPLPYPSYLDPDLDIRDEYMDDPVGPPATAFYDTSGKLAYVHQGPYDSAEALNADIDKYAQ